MKKKDLVFALVIVAFSATLINCGGSADKRQRIEVPRSNRAKTVDANQQAKAEAGQQNQDEQTDNSMTLSKGNTINISSSKMNEVEQIIQEKGTPIKANEYIEEISKAKFNLDQIFIKIFPLNGINKDNKVIRVSHKLDETANPSSGDLLSNLIGQNNASLNSPPLLIPASIEIDDGSIKTEDVSTYNYQSVEIEEGIDSNLTTNSFAEIENQINVLDVLTACIDAKCKNENPEKDNFEVKLNDQQDVDFIFYKNPMVLELRINDKNTESYTEVKILYTEEKR